MRLSLKIVAIVLLASVVPTAITGFGSLMGVGAFGESAKVRATNVSGEYLTKVGEDVVRTKAQDLALQVDIYLKN